MQDFLLFRIYWCTVRRRIHSQTFLLDALENNIHARFCLCSVIVCVCCMCACGMPTISNDASEWREKNVDGRRSLCATDVVYRFYCRRRAMYAGVYCGDKRLGTIVSSHFCHWGFSSQLEYDFCSLISFSIFFLMKETLLIWVRLWIMMMLQYLHSRCTEDRVHFPVMPCAARNVLLFRSDDPKKKHVAQILIYHAHTLRLWAWRHSRCGLACALICVVFHVDYPAI